MVSWYYVQAQDKVGPVGEEVLKDLFLKGELHLESYVWRKGFENWERLKDVSELNFNEHNAKIELKPERRIDKSPAKVLEKKSFDQSSPEINFSFDWKKIRQDEEIFFIKIGADRINLMDVVLYGPYSMNEILEAIKDQRINNLSLIFTAGMPGWIEVGDTPLNPKNKNLLTHNVLPEAPLLLVLENGSKPLITLVQIAGEKKCTLLGHGIFPVGKMVLGSIYTGSKLKAKNIKIHIEKHHPHEQKIYCNVVELNDDARKIILNYAD